VYLIYRDDTSEVVVVYLL